jgi:hypothetical protein
MHHLLGRWTSPTKDAASPAEDVGAFPKFWICDTVEEINGSSIWNLVHTLVFFSKN